MKKRGHSPDTTCSCRGITRRGFLTRMGFGAMAVAVSGPLSAVSGHGAPYKEQVLDATTTVPVSLRINGRTRRLLVEPRWTLLYVLREHLGLTGSKEGCGRGECGACTVLLDDTPRYACLTLAVEAEGVEITTLEGLMRGEELGPVQQSFLEHDAYQCGYCTPGQVMAAEGLLRRTPRPAPADIPRAMSGNLCRCGAYPNIFKAVDAASRKK